MRRSLLFVLILLGILAIRPVPTPRVEAQDTITPEDGCDAEVLDSIADTTEVIDYRAACDFYRACDPSGEGNTLCQIATFSRMLDQCPAGDQQCHDGAILMSAALLAFDYPFGEMYQWSPPQTVIDGVPQALTAFWQGNDAAALAAYQLTTIEDFPSDAMLPLSRAVLYQRLNQPDAALAEYDTIFSWYFELPLVSYARSQLYAELGRLDEAALDIIVLSTAAFNDPDVQAWVAALQTQYPLAEPGMEEWLYYPVNRYGYGYGVTADDLSLEAPRPVQVGVVEESGVMVAIGLKYWTKEAFDVPDTMAQILHMSEDGSGYTLNYPAYGENSGTLTLTPMEGGYAGRESLALFEGGVTWEFMLVPPDAPDPRLVLDASTRYCEGGVRSQLAVGAVVTSISYSGQRPLLLTDTPAGEVIAQVEKSDESYFTVVGGPECVDNVTWWEGIHSHGVRGWFAENEGTLYVAALRTIQPDTPFCAGQTPSLPIRLTVGISAVVLPDQGVNNLRREPSTEAESVGAIPPDATFGVIGGPVCVDDMVWWYADYDGVQGWTAEGQAPDYWLAPIEE